MALENHVLNLKKIHQKMKKKPKLYKMYGFFAGVPNALELDELVEFKKIVVLENRKLIRKVDKKINQVSKKLNPAVKK